MRTLSARILLGFAALTVTFGVITATVVFNMRKVEDKIRRLRLGYVPLALVSKELSRTEDDLKVYLVEGVQDDTSAGNARTNLRNSRKRRNDALGRIHNNFDQVAQLEDFDSQQFGPNIAQLQASVDALKPAYDRILAALAHGDELDNPRVTEPLRTLRDGETQVAIQTTELAHTLEFRVLRNTQGLEENEHDLRLRTIYLGLVAVVLGVLMTTWVVITLRPLRRLRDAARGVAAGDYGGRIVERGPVEVADLAREFNSMARAVEERERELVRSERLAAVGKMAAMITHEVRNPLSSIGLNTELLEEELAQAADGVEARELCLAIHREVDRLTAITEEYLAFGRLPKPKIAPEAVNKMVDALASFVREDLAAKQVELSVELGDGDPIALIDAAQLRQCLINLVRNAAEAVATKGGGRVVLRTRRASDRVVIEVEDNGTGIAADVLPRLFDPFFSTKESGSGLGLALTQQIVKDHGGELGVESTVGRGTTFKVSFPAKA